MRGQEGVIGRQLRESIPVGELGKLLGRRAGERWLGRLEEAGVVKAAVQDCSCN